MSACRDQIEIEIWSTWPDAGVCVALGFNGVVAVDIDSDDPAIVAAIEAALGDLSFVQKAGRKGRTLFYRAGPAVVSAAFSINGERVLDLLCKGKQTVVPPTIHKDTGGPTRGSAARWRTFLPRACRCCPMTSRSAWGPPWRRLVTSRRSSGPSRLVKATARGARSRHGAREPRRMGSASRH